MFFCAQLHRPLLYIFVHGAIQMEKQIHRAREMERERERERKKSAACEIVY